MSFSFDTVIQRYFSTEDLKRIRQCHVGIAGAGGLGSNCAHALVRSGFERFTIVDFDVIEPSNLNRQFYFYDQIGQPKVTALKENLKRINPELTIKTWQIRLDKENLASIFASCAVVVEAFDKADMKALFMETFLTSEKFVVSVSGLAGIGNSDQISSKKIKDTAYIVGDLTTSVSETVKPYAPRVNIAANKEADLVLEWVLQKSCTNPR